MIKKFVDFKVFEVAVPVRDSYFPKEVDFQKFTEWRDLVTTGQKKLDDFNTREISTIWFNKSKSYRGGNNVTVSLECPYTNATFKDFIINIKKKKKIGSGRYQEATYRFYNFYIRKLEDEYYLISSRFTTNKHIRNGYESEKKSNYTNKYWIADTFSELKSFMNRIISFSKTNAINF